MLEVFGEDVLSERVRILHNEAVTFLIPKHRVLIVNIIHDFVGFVQKIGNLLKLLRLMNRLRNWLFERFRLLR